jgi:LacI family transcriptional regulator
MNEKFDPSSVVDIAKLSGVSRSTVSRVLNGQANVKESTRQRVLQVIQEHNFVPNPAARALVNQRTRILGVVIPYMVSDIFADPFFPQLLQAITVAANHRDHAITLWLSSSQENYQQFYQRILNYPLLDGVIIAAALADYPIADRLNEAGKMHMFVGRPGQDQQHSNYVDVDGEAGAYLMTRHLIERGRRRIAFIPGLEELTSTRYRLQGYQRALREAGMPLLPELVAPYSDYKERMAYYSMKGLLTKVKRLDAVFASSDVMAIGAMKAIQDSGYSIPDDIAVGGFDDMPFAASSTPPLTSIYQPIGELGRLAVNGLIDLLEGRVIAPYHEILSVELRVRGST